MVEVSPEGHAGAVSAVACSLDGERLVTAGEDGTLKVRKRKTNPKMVEAPLGSSSVGSLSVGLCWAVLVGLPRGL